MNTGTETAKLATRTTEYRYNVDGLLVELVCRNGEEEQVTKWEYGVGLYEVEVEEVMVSCGVARNDLVRAKIYPDGGGDRVEYTYDRLGEVVKFEDQNGTEHEYAYDTIGRLTSDTVPVLGAGVNSEVNAISVEYTARGEVYKVASYGDPGMLDPVNEVTYSYNGMGQATAEAQWHIYPNVTKTVNYDYETPSPEGNTIRRKSIEYPSGRLVLFRYNATSLDDYMDRLSAIVDPVPDPDVDFASYEWLGAGTIVRTAYPEPEVEMTAINDDEDGDAGDKYVGLDRFGRLEDARWKKSGDDLERVEYGFDRVGNRIWRHNPLAEAQATPQYFDEYYHYDGLYQVTGLARGKLNQNRTAIGGVPTWAEGWRYDEMGNWLGYKANGGGTDLDQRRTYSAANELLMIGEDGGALSNATLAHDPAGNMTRMPKVDDWDKSQTLKWDAWNRLKEITQVISGSTVSIGKYDYDGLNRRIRKESKEGGSTVKRHLYYSDQWQVLEEFVATGSSPVVLTLERRFVWGIKTLDDLITRHVISGETTTRLYALNDGKNVTAIVNTSGVVQERYAYRGFGYTEVLDDDFDPREDNESDFTWETRFCGYRWDQESGLYQVRFRYYHPQLGRWLSRDPISDVYENGRYGYLANYPIFGVDPHGLGPVADDLTWDDFEGAPPENRGAIGAHVYWTVKLAEQGQSDEFIKVKVGWACLCCVKWKRLKLVVEINKALSWVTPDAERSRTILRHEKGHIAIAEHLVDEFNKNVLNLFACASSLRSMADACATAKRALNAQTEALLDELECIMHEREHAYDIETDHGLNPDAQDDWQKMFDF